MKPETLAQQARRLKLSVAALKARLKAQAVQRKLAKAKVDLLPAKNPLSGWTPHSGNQRRNKGV